MCGDVRFSGTPVMLCWKIQYDDDDDDDAIHKTIPSIREAASF